MQNPNLEFLLNVFAHWIAAMSSIVSFTLGIVEYFRDKKTEAKVFAVVASLFLLIAFDQAWQDEHRNVRTLISQRATAESESNFWKQQSYEKDTDLRSRDHLLEKNYSALIGEQATANQSQVALASLSGKILDINKEPQRTTFILELGVMNPEKEKHYVQAFLMTNKPVTPVDIAIACEHEIKAMWPRIVVPGGNVQLMTDPEGQRLAPNAFRFTMTSPVWTPANPLVVDLYYDEDSLGKCSYKKY